MELGSELNCRRFSFSIHLMNRKISCCLWLALLVFGVTTPMFAQGTAFMYQGRLNDSGAPANGSYDMRFAVYDAVTNGNRVSVLLTNSAVPVTNGLFAVSLDFGGIFTGTNYWLDIAVRATNVVSFTALTPRQPVLPVPYAVFAAGANVLLGKLSATQLTGTLPSAQIAGVYSGAVTFTNTTNLFGGAFSGNGGALTNLNATQLSAGTVADARLSTNVALLSNNQTFAGNNQFAGANNFTGSNNFSGVNNFTNWGNTFVGNFSGNGLVQWVAVGGTTVNATRDTGYMLTSPYLTTVTLPATGITNGDIIRISGAGSGGWRVAQNAGQSIMGDFTSYRNAIWSSAGEPANWHCLAASSDGSRMYAGLASGTGGGIYASTDYGNSWSQTSANGSSWNAIACSADGSKVYAVANATILISTNAGSSWSSTAASGNCSAVACSADGTKIVVAVKPGPIYLSTNSGASWNTSYSTALNWIALAASSDGSTFAGAVTNGNIYVSANGGSSWSATGSALNWTALAISDDGLKLAASASGSGIYVSSNAGSSWTQTGSALAWSCLAASADCSRLVAGVANGGLYGSMNFGGSWLPLWGGTNQNWAALVSSADGTSLAGAAAGTSTGDLYYSNSADQTTTTTGTSGSIFGSQATSVELQYIGNGIFMPVSSEGTVWAN